MSRVWLRKTWRYAGVDYVGEATRVAMGDLRVFQEAAGTWGFWFAMKSNRVVLRGGFNCRKAAIDAATLLTPEGRL